MLMLGVVAGIAVLTMIIILAILLCRKCRQLKVKAGRSNVHVVLYVMLGMQV